MVPSRTWKLWALALTLLLGIPVLSVLAEEPEAAPPVYPVPQMWTVLEESYELEGATLFVPRAPGAKVLAIARGLQNRLKLILEVNLEVKEASPGPAGVAILVISKQPPDWQRLVRELDLRPIPPAVADQGYTLRIDRRGVALTANAPRGLAYGAITLIQMAKGTQTLTTSKTLGRRGVTVKEMSQWGQHKPLPGVIITDWPDTPLRAAHGVHYRGAWESLDTVKLGAALAPLTRHNMAVWELDTTTFRFRTHPELFGKALGMEREAYAQATALVRAGGVEVVPNLNMGKRLGQKLGYPYAVLSEDDPTYRWATEEIFDELVEVFLPRYFHLGMNEDWHGDFGPLGRNKEQWRAAIIQFTDYLRRRGVSTMVWTDYLYGPTSGTNHNHWPVPGGRHAGAQHLKSQELAAKELAAEDRRLLGPQKRKRFLFDVEGGGWFEYCVWMPKEGPASPEFEKRVQQVEQDYFAFIKTFPSDLILVPWPSIWRPKTTYAIQQSKSGLRVIVHAKCDPSTSSSTNGVEWARSLRFVREKAKRTNVLGLLATGFSGGPWGCRASSFVGMFPRSAGPFWNPASIQDGRAKTAGDFIMPTEEEVKHPLGWEVLLDPAPPVSVREALKGLAHAKWEVWLPAREELVGAGMPAAAELLSAMTEADGEYRQRLEGCLSRIARDARHGRDRGELDVEAVEPFLDDADADVRQIAAEVLGASGRRGQECLTAGLMLPERAAACARVMALMQADQVVALLRQVLGNEQFPAVARAEAARALGLLGAKGASGDLVNVIKQERDPAVQREAAWALGLLGERGADKVIAKLLDSPDKATRCRAVIALVELRSPEVLRAAPMLASEDASEAWVAAWALSPRDFRSLFAGKYWGYYDDLVYDVREMAQVLPQNQVAQVLAEGASKQKDKFVSKRLERLARSAATRAAATTP